MKIKTIYIYIYLKMLRGNYVRNSVRFDSNLKSSLLVIVVSVFVVGGWCNYRTIYSVCFIIIGIESNHSNSRLIQQQQKLTILIRITVWLRQYIWNKLNFYNHISLSFYDENKPKKKLVENKTIWYQEGSNNYVSLRWWWKIWNERPKQSKT